VFAGESRHLADIDAVDDPCGEARVLGRIAIQIALTLDEFVDFVTGVDKAPQSVARARGVGCSQQVGISDHVGVLGLSCLGTSRGDQARAKYQDGNESELTQRIQ